STAPGKLILNSDLFLTAATATATIATTSVGAGQSPGVLDLGGATRNIDVSNGSADVDGLISARVDNGGITKTGLGTLQITAVNTYTGPTNVTAGTLRLGTAAAIPAASSVDVSNGASIDLAGNTHIFGALSGAGT